MRHCKDCEHWEREGHYECEAPYHDREALWGYCVLTDVDKHRKALMYASAEQGDCPDVEPVIKTRADFGCVMFEERKARD